MTVTSETLDRRHLAAQLFRVILKNALGAVPVVGPILSVGVELLEVAQQEVAGAKYMTRADVVTLLAELDRLEIDHIVDDALNAPASYPIVAHRNAQEILALRRHLVEIPSQLTSAVLRAENCDRNGVACSGTRVEARREKLERRLTSYINEERWWMASLTIKRLFQMGRVSSDVMNAELYLYRRMWTPGRLAAAIAFISVPVYAGVGYLAASTWGRSLGETVGVLLFGASAVWSLASRRVRLPTRNSTFLILVLLPFIVFALAWGWIVIPNGTIQLNYHEFGP